MLVTLFNSLFFFYWPENLLCSWLSDLPKVLSVTAALRGP
jgi:hypothetical protein